MNRIPIECAASKCHKRAIYCPTYRESRATFTIPPNVKLWKSEQYIDIPIGSLGFFAANRCPADDIFIVVASNSNSMTVIFPRLHILSGKIIFGQDRMVALAISSVSVVLGREIIQIMTALSKNHLKINNM